MTEFRSLLKSCLEEMGLRVGEESIKSMEAHWQLIQESSKWLNLTAIHTTEEAVIKHYVDSLSLLRILDDFQQCTHAIDIGSGAGFPSIPLALARPQWHWTAVESRRKRADFLEAVVQRLRIRNVEIAADRSESLAADPARRESYQLATARAVSSFGALCELLLPFVSIEGKAVAMKGQNENFADASEEVLAKLGAERAVQWLEYELPRGMGKRRLYLLTKVGKTPLEFPRAPGKASKRPLF